MWADVKKSGERVLPEANQSEPDFAQKRVPIRRVSACAIRHNFRKK
jgi:hypothetical protein